MWPQMLPLNAPTNTVKKDNKVFVLEDLCLSCQSWAFERCFLGGAEHGFLEGLYLNTFHEHIR